jgi:hypothetical protein
MVGKRRAEGGDVRVRQLAAERGKLVRSQCKHQAPAKMMWFRMIVGWTLLCAPSLP